MDCAKSIIKDQPRADYLITCMRVFHSGIVFFSRWLCKISLRIFLCAIKKKIISCEKHEKKPARHGFRVIFLSYLSIWLSRDVLIYISYGWVYSVRQGWPNSWHASELTIRLIPQRNLVYNFRLWILDCRRRRKRSVKTRSEFVCKKYRSSNLGKRWKFQLISHRCGVCPRLFLEFRCYK